MATPGVLPALQIVREVTAPRDPLYARLRRRLHSETNSIGWNDGDWLFPKAVHLLEVQEYRKFILPGLVLSMGSKTDSTVSNELYRVSSGVAYCAS